MLHRLFVAGSDRAADTWRRYDRIEGCDSLQLHHLYRAMAWLGQELPRDQQKDATPFAPRCTKDRIEEELLEHRRDLFSELQLVFFDTTSIYFEGQGGREPGAVGLQQGPPARTAADDQQGDDRGVGAGPAGVAVHPGGRVTRCRGN